MRVLALLVLVAVSVVTTGCLEQFNPFPTLKKFKEERVQSIQPAPKLTETGELPSGSAKDVSIDDLYSQYCASCHGSAGDGAGPAGVALNPKPRNFTDAAWKSSVDDARITKVIKEGGASVGLSPMMAPFGAVLTDDQLKQMVVKVLSFK
jgi:hypothetical protein